MRRALLLCTLALALVPQRAHGHATGAPIELDGNNVVLVLPDNATSDLARCGTGSTAVDLIRSVCTDGTEGLTFPVAVTFTGSVEGASGPHAYETDATDDYLTCGETAVASVDCADGAIVLTWAASSIVLTAAVTLGGDVTIATGLSGGFTIAHATAAANTAGQATTITGQAGGAAATDGDGKAGGAITITGGAGSALNGAGANDGSGADVILSGGDRGGAGGTAVRGIVRVGAPTLASTRAVDLLGVAGGLEVDGAVRLDGGDVTLGAATAITMPDGEMAALVLDDGSGAWLTCDTQNEVMYVAKETQIAELNTCGIDAVSPALFCPTLELTVHAGESDAFRLTDGEVVALHWDSDTDTFTIGTTNLSLPDNSVDSNTIINGEVDTGDIATDAVALGTQTTGHYVASVSTSAPISGGAAGSEGATISLSLASEGVTATHLADVERCIPLPILSWYHAADGLALDTSDGADTKPDREACVPAVSHWGIAFDAVTAEQDDDTSIRTELLVPADYVSGGLVRVAASKDGDLPAGDETLECARALEGESLGSYGTVAITDAAPAIYDCTPAGATPAVAGDPLVLDIRIASSPDLSDKVCLQSIAWCYTASR